MAGKLTVSQLLALVELSGGVLTVSQLLAHIEESGGVVNVSQVGIYVETSPLTAGDTTWGHDTGVVETNIRDFADNWTGTGTIVASGDAETICLGVGEYMISEILFTDTGLVEIDQNKYDITGDDVILEFRHGVTPVACEAAGWQNYVAPFNSAGYMQIRVTPV